MADKISRYDVSLALKAYSTTMSLTKLQQTEDALNAALKREAELEAKLEKAVGALDEAVYLLAPTEDDMEKRSGVYRVVTTLAELEDKTDE